MLEPPGSPFPAAGSRAIATPREAAPVSRPLPHKGITEAQAPSQSRECVTGTQAQAGLSAARAAGLEALRRAQAVMKNPGAHKSSGMLGMQLLLPSGPSLAENKANSALVSAMESALPARDETDSCDTTPAAPSSPPVQILGSSDAPHSDDASDAKPETDTADLQSGAHIAEDAGCDRQAGEEVADDAVAARNKVANLLSDAMSDGSLEEVAEHVSQKDLKQRARLGFSRGVQMGSLAQALATAPHMKRSSVEPSACSGDNALSNIITASEPSVDVKSVRKKAAQALGDALNSNSLGAIMERFDSKDVKQRARLGFMRGVQDGSLANVMSSSSNSRASTATSAPTDESQGKQSDISAVRAKAIACLMDTERLTQAVDHIVSAQKSETDESDLSAVRAKAARCLTEAYESERLTQGVDNLRAKDLKKHARLGFVRGAQEGSLANALSSSSHSREAPAASAPTEGLPTEERNISAAREKAATCLIEACKSDRLTQAVERLGSNDLKQRARLGFRRGVREGSLALALASASKDVSRAPSVKDTPLKQPSAPVNPKRPSGSRPSSGRRLCKAE